MRRINSEFHTRFLSEEGQKLSNRDYFGYAEMDDFACYALADSLDGEPLTNSAKTVVESLIRSFGEGPSMRKGRLNRYMMEAHRELLKQRGGMHLKASVILAVTDYRKVRYCYVGNSRLCLLRNARLLFQTQDQSLAREMLEEENLPLDRAAAHEERNNLYSYLGERGTPEILTSKKQKLEDGDILAMLTRGAWEALSGKELLELSKDAKEPQEILDGAEDLILGKQERTGIDNYTLAVTFVDKIYRSPKRKLPLKKVLMIALPVALAAGGISLGLYLKHRSMKHKEESLAQYMDSGGEYMQYDNYQKAADDYTQAKKLASSLKRTDEAAKADQYLKLSQQIGLADGAMKDRQYQKAQDLYLTARDLSQAAGNVGKKYIDSQLVQTKFYIDVYDLIEFGTQKEENGDLDGAIAAYKEARDKAAALYDSDGKDEAMKKEAAAEQKAAQADQKAQAQSQAAVQESQAAAESQAAEQKAQADKEQESQKAREELNNQQKANDQKNAIDLENQGNQLFADGKYESAITYYRTAQAIYTRLELAELADVLNNKIAAAQAGIAARDGGEPEQTEPQTVAGKAAAQTAGSGVKSSKTEEQTRRQTDSQSGDSSKSGSLARPKSGPGIQPGFGTGGRQ